MKRILTMALAVIAAMAFGAFSSAVSTVVSNGKRKEEGVFEAKVTVTAPDREGETSSPTAGSSAFSGPISTESITSNMSLQSEQRRSGGHDVDQVNKSLS